MIWRKKSCCTCVQFEIKKKASHLFVTDLRPQISVITERGMFSYLEYELPVASFNSAFLGCQLHIHTIFLNGTIMQFLTDQLPRPGGGGGGGGGTRVTYFAEEGVFFKTSACPRFCKRRVLFCTHVRSMGVKIPLQSTKYTQL